MNISNKEELGTALVKLYKIRPPFYTGRLSLVKRNTSDFIVTEIYVGNSGMGISYSVEVPIEFFNKEYLEKELELSQEQNV